MRKDKNNLKRKNDSLIFIMKLPTATTFIPAITRPC